MPQRYLVTAATGSQGSAVARQLRDSGHFVHCLVRRLNSEVAEELYALGCELVLGDFDNTEALKLACAGCHGIFLNTQPGQPEAQHASNVLSAAKSAGVQVVVCATVTRAEEHESFPHGSDEGVMAEYWKGKAAVQDLVQKSGIERWTILQPAWFMTNFVAPVSKWYWPELGSEGVLLSACKPETKVQMTDPEDVARFTVAALTAPSRDDTFNRRIVKIASEEITMHEAAALMSEVGSSKVEAKFRTEEEVARLADSNPFVWTQRWQAEDGTKVDLDEVKRFGLRLTSLREFFEREREELRAALTHGNENEK